MTQLFKRNKGKYFIVHIQGQTPQEVIQWRDFFFNWGAIQIAKGRDNEGELDLSGALDRQEKEVEEIGGNFHFEFAAKREKIINAFKCAAEANVPPGRRARNYFSERVQQQALARFESIPDFY